MFADKLHKVNTDLLISDIAAGAKYEFMARKGKPIVRLKWLQDCLQQVSYAVMKQWRI